MEHKGGALWARYSVQVREKNFTSIASRTRTIHTTDKAQTTASLSGKRILQQNSLAQHWARDWREKNFSSARCGGGVLLPPLVWRARFIYLFMAACRPPIPPLGGPFLSFSWLLERFFSVFDNTLGFRRQQRWSRLSSSIMLRFASNRVTGGCPALLLFVAFWTAFWLFPPPYTLSFSFFFSVFLSTSPVEKSCKSGDVSVVAFSFVRRFFSRQPLV